jgi:hypothetical protein
MKKIFTLIVLTAIAISAFPQRNLTALQYSIGFGTGDMHDYIGKTSFRGFTFDYRNLATANLGVGVEFGWNTFYEEMADNVYEYRNLTYSGKQWRYSNHFPMLAAADYYFKPDANLSGFAGLGIGTMYTLQNTDMATYTFERDAWHFTLRPEAGILIKAAPGVGLTLAAKYYYGFKAGDLPAQAFMTISFGFVFIP